MIYAKQVNPEYQDCDYWKCDVETGTIILAGNRYYNDHTTDEFDHIVRYFDEMADAWDTAIKYHLSNGCYVEREKPGRPERHGEPYSIKELLSEFWFSRSDGKPWTTKQRHEWRLLMERGAKDDDDLYCRALELMTGHKWEYTTIRGCCQGDWQGCYYQVDAWTDKALEYFETEYFNTGTEWEIHDGSDDIEGPEDIDGYMYYAHEWGIDGIRLEIAESEGVKPEEVKLWEFDGYNKTPRYKEAV